MGYRGKACLWLFVESTRTFWTWEPREPWLGLQFTIESRSEQWPVILTIRNKLKKQECSNQCTSWLLGPALSVCLGKFILLHNAYCTHTQRKTCMANKMVCLSMMLGGFMELGVVSIHLTIIILSFLAWSNLLEFILTITIKVEAPICLKISNCSY